MEDGKRKDGWKKNAEVDRRDYIENIDKRNIMKTATFERTLYYSNSVESAARRRTVKRQTERTRSREKQWERLRG